MREHQLPQRVAKPQRRSALSAHLAKAAAAVYAQRPQAGRRGHGRPQPVRRQPRLHEREVLQPRRQRTQPRHVVAAALLRAL